LALWRSTKSGRERTPRARTGLALGLLALAVLLAPDAGAEISPGRTGATLKGPTPGCAQQCHGFHGNPDGDPGLTVTISGPALLNADQVGTYTVVATKAGVPEGTRMGLDVATSDTGALRSIGGQSTELLAGEVVHSMANPPFELQKTTIQGSATYSFLYRMPAGAVGGSTHTIYATAALGRFGWNYAPNVVVTTRPAAPSSLTASNVTTTTVDLAWSGGGPEYRVVYKPGTSPPASESDGTAANVGSVTSMTLTGLPSGTPFGIAVFSKVSGQNLFSTSGAGTLIVTEGAPPTNRYVNAISGSDGSSCQDPSGPCRTITYAMSQALAGNPGDTIHVAPGTYNVGLGEDFPIVFKSGVQLIASGNPANTIIDATGDIIQQGIIRSSLNGSPAARIQGFTFTNGLALDPTACAVSQGGALLVTGSIATFTVARNVFANNEARGRSATSASQNACGARGGAIAAIGSVVAIENNVFTSNIARGGNGNTHAGTLTGAEGGGPGQAGAIYVEASGAIINNTFRANSAKGGTAGVAENGTANGGSALGGAISAVAAPDVPVIANNIFAGNVADSGIGGVPLPASAGALTAPDSPSIRNNLFINNLVNGDFSTGDDKGTPVVEDDPLFHAAPGNLRLRTGSPAKGAGSATGAPLTDLDGATRPAAPSIGAYETSLVVPITMLTSSRNPSPPGQSVTFTADVDTAANDTVGGTVTFKNGASILCGAIALSDGTAQCVAGSLATGTHFITAEYSGSATYAATQSPILSQIVTDNPARLVNLSTRAQVQGGFNLMIGGFVISGATSKTVVIRAIGPSLAGFGVSGAIGNPQLQLVRSSDNATIAANDDWGNQPNAAQVQASGFAPSHPLESALYVNLLPGAYTAIVSGAGGATGLGLVEVYEIDQPDTGLINLSTRASVQTGFDVMIGGFVIQGVGSQTVVIRAIGPSLANFGVSGALQDPTMQLVRLSDNAVIAANDNWQSGANAAQIQSRGLAPSHPSEAAVMLTLPPGAYTAIVSGVGDTTGVGLVEVYKVTP